MSDLTAHAFRASDSVVNGLGARVPSVAVGLHAGVDVLGHAQFDTARCRRIDPIADVLHTPEVVSSGFSARSAAARERPILETSGVRSS
jgi:hypothetical protein